MTIFGFDISERPDGLSLTRARADGFELVSLRLCDGTYVDKTSRLHLEDAGSAELLVSTYWYLRTPSEGTSIVQQVVVIDRRMGGRHDLSGTIDVESVNRAVWKLLTAADVWEAKRELESREYYVAGIYSGAWYWELMLGGVPAPAHSPARLQRSCGQAPPGRRQGLPRTRAELAAFFTPPAKTRQKEARVTFVKVLPCPRTQVK